MALYDHLRSIASGIGAAIVLYAKNAATGDTEITAQSTGELDENVKRWGGGAVTAAAALSSDGVAASSVAPLVAGGGYRFNGTTWDRERGNVEGTALASAVRNSAGGYVSTDVTNHNCRGIYVFFDVTDASGTGGVTLYVEAKDPISGVYRAIHDAFGIVTTTGNRHYLIYPGLLDTLNNATAIVNGIMPRTFRFKMTHGDGSNYTYSVSYCLIV